jgi:hypothetical protein
MQVIERTSVWRSEIFAAGRNSRLEMETRLQARKTAALLNRKSSDWMYTEPNREAQKWRFRTAAAQGILEVAESFV